MAPRVLLLLLLATWVAADLVCPPGYEKQGNEVCYKVYTESLTRDQASQRCAADGATLIELHNAFTSTLVKSLTRSLNNFWLGATCTSNNPTSCIYDTGKRVSFNDFNKGQADLSHGGPCILMFPEHTHSWSSYRCNYHAFVVCQFDGVRALQCPPGYSIFAGNCYKATEAGVEEDQEKTCNADGGHLASIHSLGENTYITDMVPPYYLSNTRITTVRIGLNRNSKKFSWFDGTSLDYTNFATTKPSGNCVEMPFNLQADHQTWKPADCKNKIPAVCKTGSTVATIPAPTTTSSTTTTTTTTTTTPTTTTSTTTAPTTTAPTTTAPTTTTPTTTTLTTTTPTTTTTTTTTPPTTTTTSPITTTSTTTTTTKPTTTTTTLPPTTTTLTPTQQSGCNYGIIQAPGTIWSPYFPLDYRNNENCLYSLVAPEGSRIELSFTAFDTEHTFDNVAIYDGDSNNSPSLGIYSGKRIPDPIQSTGNKMTVKFTSDPMTRFSGFQANFKSITNQS